MYKRTFLANSYFLNFLVIKKRENFLFMKSYLLICEEFFPMFFQGLFIKAFHEYQYSHCLQFLQHPSLQRLGTSQVSVNISHPSR